jgi:hypothetical protein
MAKKVISRAGETLSDSQGLGSIQLVDWIRLAGLCEHSNEAPPFWQGIS